MSNYWKNSEGVDVKQNYIACPSTNGLSYSGGQRVDIVIPPGGILVTPDIVIAADLLLISASGVPECEVFVIGT